MDIKSTKNAAGEVFLCFNEHSHNYKLFLNLIKATEAHPDTALKALAQGINKAILASTIENDNGQSYTKPSISPSTSDGGLTHTLLTNLTNKLDLLFNSISGLKNNVSSEPVQHQLDPEVLEIFGKRLEQSLGTLIATKTQVASNMPILPENFAEQVIAALKNNASHQCNIDAIKPTLDFLKSATTKISDDINKNAAQVTAALNKKGTELQDLISKQCNITNLTNITKQLNDYISKEKTEQLLPTTAATVQEPTQVTPLPAAPTSTETSEPSVFPGEDGVVRYPASKKKAQPSCYAKFLSNDTKTTPCVSCAWINDCKKATKSVDAKSTQGKENKPECFGKHKGDLDCSMCSLDSECNDAS